MSRPPTYTQILVSEEDAIAAAAADDDDGELLTLEAIVSQLFELLLLFVSSETYRVGGGCVGVYVGVEGCVCPVRHIQGRWWVVWVCVCGGM